jgi:hypothetical protein
MTPLGKTDRTRYVLWLEPQRNPCRLDDYQLLEIGNLRPAPKFSRDLAPGRAGGLTPVDQYCLLAVAVVVYVLLGGARYAGAAR